MTTYMIPGIFEAGSLICGTAPTSVALVIGRAIAGVGAGGLSSGCFIIIGYIAPPSKRPVFLGLLGASYGYVVVCLSLSPFHFHSLRSCYAAFANPVHTQHRQRGRTVTGRRAYRPSDVEMVFLSVAAPSATRICPNQATNSLFPQTSTSPPVAYRAPSSSSSSPPPLAPVPSKPGSSTRCGTWTSSAS